MTLVVAQATEYGPRITSDIQISKWDGSNASLRDGTLKAIVISPRVTICFAGHIALGLGAVREFAAGINSGHSVDDLIPVLNRVSATGAVDFIVAQRHRVEQLTRITEKGVERRLPIAWIGDQAGFAHFQRARSNVLPEAQITNQSASIMSELRAAMKAVVDDDAIANVGGFEIAVANTEAGFEYLGYVHIQPGRDFSTPSEVDDLIPYMIQSAKEGGYTVCLVEPMFAGVPAAALYFPTGGVAMIFLPLKFDTAQVITDVRPAEFSRIVQDRFGIAMKPPGGPLQSQILARN